MNIHHFGGTSRCITIDELSSILDMRYATGANEFLISGDKDYPYLAIMVNNEYAVLVFFSEDEEFLPQAIGGEATLGPDEMSVFYTGTKDEEIHVRNKFVVPFEKAKEAAIEFFTTLSLPTCLKWSKQ